MTLYEQLSMFGSLFEPESYHCIGMIDKNGIKQKFNKYKDVVSMREYLMNQNEDGYNIYITPSTLKAKHRRRRRKGDFEDEQNLIYLDLDDREAAVKLTDNYPKPNVVIVTSYHHYQTYWMLDEQVSIKQQEDLMKRISLHIGADNTYDVSRFMRIPGYRNMKQGKGNKIEIVVKNNDVVDYKTLDDIAPKLKTKKYQKMSYPINQRTDISGQLRWNNFIVQKPDGDIDRSRVDFRYTIYLIGQGMDNNSIAQRLSVESPDIEDRKWNAESYIARTIHKAHEVITK